MKKIIVGLLMLGSFSAFSQVELLSRSKYHDYERANYSFYYMTQDSNITYNNYEIQFGNGGNTFHVNMVTDDVSFIIDLGKDKSCDEIASSGEGTGALSAANVDIRDYIGQNSVEAVEGHCYLSINNDSDTSIITLFRVKKLIKNDRATLDQIHVLKKH